MNWILILILSLVLLGALVGLCLVVFRLANQVNRASVDQANSIRQEYNGMRQEISDRMHNQFALVTRELREGLQQTTTGLEAKFNALESKVSVRLGAIGKEVQTKLDKNLQDGFSQFQKIQELLGNAEKQLLGLNTVGSSIQELNNVLNMPHLRGKIIGEGTLERLLADFLPAGFYEFQFAIEGALVDAVIKFPHLSLVLPIDSKFSMEQVSALFEGNADPERLKAARKKFSEVTKSNAREISKKYVKPALGTTDYALMYLPSETLYFEVIRDNELWSQLVDQKVFPVSPNTLAITVNSIGKSLQYYEMAKGVKKTISQIQTARDHLDNFKKRFDDIGEKLVKAQDSFQKATTHFSYYTSSVERLAKDQETLGAIASDATSAAPPMLDT